MKPVCLLGTIALLALGTACSDPDSVPAGAQTPTSPSAPQMDAASTPAGRELQWGPAPPVFPAGAEMAVMQGNPGAAGAIFTVRLRFPNGYRIPAHWHPTDEHVTVLSGTFLVGMGDRFDERALLPPFRAGGFVTAPANMNHFAMARGRTVVQVHAIGPFAMTYVNPADDPRNQ
jgi:quercetin dioxygenase-like cupin family protein